MTQNPINAIIITIYNKRHTNNTKIHFPTIQKNRKTKIHISAKNQNDQRFMLICMGLFIICIICIIYMYKGIIINRS